jgi:hypothetical protein
VTSLETVRLKSRTCAALGLFVPPTPPSDILTTALTNWWAKNASAAFVKLAINDVLLEMRLCAANAVQLWCCNINDSSSRVQYLAWD